MRFVSTADTVRLDLSDGHWIEVKPELSAGDERAYRSAGFRRVSQRDSGQSEVDVDWTAMAFARVEAYLVDWSAQNAKGKAVPVTPAAIRNLDAKSFEEIDEAIKAHIEATEAKKSERPGATSSTDSPS